MIAEITIAARKESAGSGSPLGETLVSQSTR